jgi:hypothetical protein
MRGFCRASFGDRFIAGYHTAQIPVFHEPREASYAALDAADITPCQRVFQSG